MPTRNVVLTEHQAGLVEQLVASGRYQNASEVLREGLRLVEQRDAEQAARIAAFRDAVQLGEADLAAGRRAHVELRPGADRFHDTRGPRAGQQGSVVSRKWLGTNSISSFQPLPEKTSLPSCATRSPTGAKRRCCNIEKRWIVRSTALRKILNWAAHGLSLRRATEPLLSAPMSLSTARTIKC